MGPGSSVVDRLVASKQAIHGWAPDVEVDWSLGERALRIIAGSVREGDRTLETGCGYSTVVFAAAGASHTVVSPLSFEHDRIRAWCEGNGVSTSTVTFHAGFSQDVLPHLEDEALDFVLVDGGHALPLPFIDWYYAARRLRPGGLLLVDDTQIKSGEILRDFLRSEAGRWRLVETLPTSALFERVGTELLPPDDWCGQPYCARPRRVRGLGPSTLDRVRSRVRLRTRLSALRARFRPG